jgi:hypothetical protein
MTTLVWALTAAVLYGTGAALQQRQAAATPSHAAGRPRLLLLLARRPWWLLGMGAELGGFATHAVALRTGPLTIVQMLVASSLLFSVATVRLWSGRRLSWTAWAAVLAVMAGIASFVALASPASGEVSIAGVPRHAGLAVACLAACAVPLAAAGLATAGRRRAIVLAVAAGIADAGIAVVTMAFSHSVSGGLTGVAGSWVTYALMLGGPCSLLLTQTAYQAGRPMITLPVIAVVTPVASLAAGNLLLGESAQLGVLRGAAAALAVLATSAGLVVLARMTTGQPGPVGNRGSSDALPAFPAPGSRSSVAAGEKRQDCRPQQGHTFVVGQAVRRTEVHPVSAGVENALRQDRDVLRRPGEREPVKHVVWDQPTSGIVVARRDEPLDLPGQTWRERASRIEPGHHGQVLSHFGPRAPSCRPAVPGHDSDGAQHYPDLLSGPARCLAARKDSVPN